MDEIKISNRLTTQLTSGRWLLTVMAGVSFLCFSLATAYLLYKQKVEVKSETLIAMFSSLLLVIQGVYKDYFNKNGDSK